MKLKNLNKKIRRLEVRLQKGAKKLAKLKQKLGAAATAGVPNKKKKSAARAGRARKTVKASARTEKEKRRLTSKPRVEPAAVKGRSAAKKVKRKLNLTPERRAQLAAAMKARWAGKRAAADATPQNTSTDPGLTLGDASQPQ
jgi:hypothetical protein